ncbi:unnamed protein product, partial [Didymodactylos carnosus]
YAILEDGSLLIREASASDSGIYTCNATNKYGFDSSSGTLNVKRKTRIQTKPGDQEVRRGYYAIFRCTAIADDSLTYSIDWYKDGRLLAYTGRFIKDTADQNTLKIVDVQFDDGGSYICRASTELDSDDASATLVVQDRPNRPRITRVNCSGTTQNSFGQPFAIVNWEATGDNNARILYYELQYNTTFTQSDWISVPIEQRRESYNEIRSQDGSIRLEPKTTVFRTTHLPSNQNDIRVSLSCWANYTFRVIAYNRVGASNPSPISETMCTTTTCRPQRNPVGVKSYTTQFSFLTIEWDSMPEIKWNSPKFWYEVGWKRLDQQPPGPFRTLRIDPPQNILVVPDVVPNVRYQYYVKAYNQQPGETNGGDANEPITYHTAFSGDSAPSYIPRNFRVINVFDATTVQFAWDPPILMDEPNIRGTLKGYQIEVFRADDPDNSLRITRDILPNATMTTIFNAPPNSDVLARIRIETERYLGPTSPTVQFPTPEGRPGPVTNLRAVPYSGNGIYLFWNAPDEPNGHIEGYQIDYKTIESIVAEPGNDFPSIDIRDEFRRNYLLGGLKPNIKYRIQVRARTSRGLSVSPAIIEITTNQSLVPSKPSFVISAVGNTFFNISFNPDTMAVPGSVFFARYKENDKDGQAIYKKTYDVTNERTIVISPLDPGRDYFVFLVASDGIKSEVESDRQYIRTRGMDPGTNITKSAWFIGTIISLVVLIIILAVVCGVMRKRGGKYSVQDKETLHGHDYGQDDGKFSEYYRAPSDASIKKSTTSLADGRQDDDRDSMAEFGDGQDRQSRFAEDGSFIGQYGNDDKRRTYLVKYDETNGEQPPYSTSVSNKKVDYKIELLYLRCKQCRQIIESDESYLYDGETTVHINCYKCTNCDNSLAGQFYYRFTDPRNTSVKGTYCEACYLRIVPKCFHCLQIIDDLSLTYGEKIYHINCFQCDLCRDPFKGTLLYPYENKVYCAQCFRTVQKDFRPAPTNILGQKCNVCRVKFEPGEQITKHEISEINETRFIHKSCFVCELCHRSLANLTYYTPNNHDEQLSADHITFQCEKCHSESNDICSICFKISDNTMVIKQSKNYLI